MVVLACIVAAHSARLFSPARAHAAMWIAIAVFFALLAAARLANLEELWRDELRDWLRASGSYENRRTFQAPLTVGLALLAVAGLTWLLMKWRKAERRRTKALIVAAFGVAAMTSLVALRSVSLHAFDAMLYGPLKLNWVGDIGSALLVLGAAVYYVRVTRQNAPPR